LLQQKAALGQGNFLPWVWAEFGMSEDTAQKYMRIARELDGNTESSRYLSFEAMAKLAAPSTPAEVREEVMERASNGEKVTAKLGCGPCNNRTLVNPDAQVGNSEALRHNKNSPLGITLNCLLNLWPPI